MVRWAAELHGEDVAELHVHGSLAVVRGVLAALGRLRPPHRDHRPPDNDGYHGYNHGGGGGGSGGGGGGGGGGGNSGSEDGDGGDGSGGGGGRLIHQEAHQGQTGGNALHQSSFSLDSGCQLTTSRPISRGGGGAVRHAEPGEFTRRAFRNGKLDLTQVDAPRIAPKPKL